MISVLIEFLSHFKLEVAHSDISVAPTDGLVALSDSRKEINNSDVTKIHISPRFSECPASATREEFAKLAVELDHLR